MFVRGGPAFQRLLVGAQCAPVFKSSAFPFPRGAGNGADGSPLRRREGRCFQPISAEHSDTQPPTTVNRAALMQMSREVNANAKVASANRPDRRRARLRHTIQNAEWYNFTCGYLAWRLSRDCSFDLDTDTCHGRKNIRETRSWEFENSEALKMHSSSKQKGKQYAHTNIERFS